MLETTIPKYETTITEINNTGFLDNLYLKATNFFTFTPQPLSYNTPGGLTPEKSDPMPSGPVQPGFWDSVLSTIKAPFQGPEAIKQVYSDTRNVIIAVLIILGIAIILIAKKSSVKIR